MNYFELFNIPVQLKVDKELLRERYFAISRQLQGARGTHHRAGKTPEPFDELTRAYHTLQSEDDTIRYVLQQKGLWAEEERYHLSPAFLMQLQEWKEELENPALPDDANTRARVLQQLTELEQMIYEPVRSVIEHYQEGITT